MNELKLNYVVLAAIVACITVHSWKQLNSGTKTTKVVIVEARTTGKLAEEASLQQHGAAIPVTNR